MLFVVGGDGVPPESRSPEANLVYYADADLRGLDALIERHINR